MNKKLAFTTSLIIALICILDVALTVQSVRASGTIRIRPDGSVLGTDKIQRNGDIYIVTDNINDPIIVEKNDITVDGAGCTVQGVGEGTGLDLYNRNNVTVRNFRVAGFQTGIRLNFSTNNKVLGNIITSGDHEPGFAGIYVYHSDQNNVANNTVLNNEHGILLAGSDENFVEFNDVTNNTNVGIYLFSSDYNNVTNNIALNNKYGIRVVRCGDCSFCWNNITNSHDVGIFLNSRLLATSNFILLENDISNNDVGIWLWNSSGNTIYHNNFFNNVIQVSLHNSYNNNWDDGFEGNYWSDYHGNDINEDGIGDVSYSIDENDQDKYPLMAKFQQFSIQIENELYKIGAVCNSTILSEKNELSFRLSHVNGAAFCRLCIPNALIEPPYLILVGPPYNETNPLGYRKVETSETQTWIYFVCPHSATITIVKAVEPLSLWFQWWFWGICALAIVATTVFGKYLLQRRTIESYKRQLESFRQISHLGKAKMGFEADVQRCQQKLEDFTRKYDIRIRYRPESLEDALKRMGIEEKNKK